MSRDDRPSTDWRRLDAVVAELKRSVEEHHRAGREAAAGEAHEALVRVEHARRVAACPVLRGRS